MAVYLDIPSIPSNVFSPDPDMHSKVYEAVQGICFEVGAGTSSTLSKSLGMLINASFHGPTSSVRSSLDSLPTRVSDCSHRSCLGNWTSSYTPEHHHSSGRSLMWSSSRSSAQRRARRRALRVVHCGLAQWTNSILWSGQKPRVRRANQLCHLLRPLRISSSRYNNYNRYFRQLPYKQFHRLLPFYRPVRRALF